MHSQTLKRQAEDVIFNNDDGEYDVTLGSKKSRYLYTYTLQSPDLFSNISDSDQTESIYSVQSKSTIEVTDELDLELLSQTSCGSDCHSEYQSSSQTDHTEFTVTKHAILLNIDKGYSPDDTDCEETVLETNLLFQGYFKTCILCRKVNPNPNFQYCNKCFRYRLQLFESKSDPKPKSIKRLNKMSSSSSSCKDSQESSSFGLSGLCLSQESTSDTFQNSANLCNVCFLKPKNGIFNHGKTGHVYCCYSCAKQIWRKSGKCPICNLKVRYVTKIVMG